MHHNILNIAVDKIVFYFMCSNLQDQASQAKWSTSFTAFFVQNALLISAALLNTSGGGPDWIDLVVLRIRYKAITNDSVAYFMLPANVALAT